MEKFNAENGLMGNNYDRKQVTQKKKGGKTLKKLTQKMIELKRMSYMFRLPRYPKKSPINIHLMSYIRKMVEFMICPRITRWLEQNSLIPPNIFGFRHQFSIIDCVSTLVADI